MCENTAMKARRKTKGQTPEQMNAVLKGIAERHNENLRSWPNRVEAGARTIRDSSKSSEREKRLARGILGHASAVKQGIEVAFNAFQIGMSVQMLHDLPALLVGSKVKGWCVWRGKEVYVPNPDHEQILRHIGDDDEGSAGAIKHINRKSLKKLNDSLREQNFHFEIKVRRYSADPRFTVCKI